MTPEAVRDELARVLASEAFAGAGRHARLLQYLVERTLAGEGNQLKEYVLGTEVFDRSDAYDPRLDSIVRVEVRRLRRRLDEYYRQAGARDPIVISIPRGRYEPSFAARSEPESAGAAAERPHAPRRWFALTGVTAAVALILLVVAASFRSEGVTGRRATDPPGIAVLPFEHYSTSEEAAMLAARMTDAVAAELARLGTVSVASRTSAAAAAASGPRDLPGIANALDVAYVMEATAIQSAGRVRVVARLVDAARDRKIWVGEYTVGHDDLPAAARTIAEEAAAAANEHRQRSNSSGQPSGAR